jgi:hypothetical protein
MEPAVFTPKAVPPVAPGKAASVADFVDAGLWPFRSPSSGVPEEQRLNLPLRASSDATFGSGGGGALCLLVSDRWRVFEMIDARPVFIHAWWRSGSTYIWSKLRENESCVCYYEPLHERLANLTPEGVEMSSEIGRSQVLRHPVQTKNYFAEYGNLLRAKDLKFFPELSYDAFLLVPEERDDRLGIYIENLIESARAAQRKAVLCFCRSQMRAAWMKAMFGGFHVCQIRNPFDQWASFNIESYFPTMMLTIALRLRGRHPSAFAHIEAFERFALGVSKRPSFPIDQLYSFFLKQHDLAAVFMVIWLASTLQAISHSDFVLDIDRLSLDVEYRKAAALWYQSIGCRVDFSDCASPISEQRSDEANKALALAINAVRSNASSLVVAVPDVVKKRAAELSPENGKILLRTLE